jgi:hypothetical protein
MQAALSEYRISFIGLTTGFGALGMLIGTLLAMSAQSLAQAVIAAIFALFGGSLLVLLEKLSERDQIKICGGLLGVALGTLLGLYSGLYINEHQLLTPIRGRQIGNVDPSHPPVEPRKYLRSDVSDKIDAVDMKYRSKVIGASEAYDELRALINDKP